MTRNRLRVAALQLDCSGTVVQVEARAVRLVKTAARRGAEVVCLPEHWIPDPRADIADTVPLFADLARETGTFIVMGAGLTRTRRAVSVESIITGPWGRVGAQRKVHLFGREKSVAAAGDRYAVFDLGGVRAGIAICHDLVYPEVARILALKGAEVIFAPARISKAGLEPWALYCTARSLENRVPVVSPNVLSLPRFTGGSMIVGVSAPNGEGIVYPEVLGRAGAKPAVVIADLNLSSSREARKQRLRARRPDTYSALLRTSGGTKLFP